MDTTYTELLTMRTRRLIGLGLWAGGIVFQLTSFWLWLGYRMSTHTFYHDACMVSVCLFVVGIALYADGRTNERGFDVTPKEK